MAQKLCLNTKGECYVNRLKELDTPEKTSINDKQAWKMAYVLRPAMKKQNRTPEQLELDNMPVIKEEGSYSTVRKELAEFYALAAVQAAAKNAKSGR